MSWTATVTVAGGPDHPRLGHGGDTSRREVQIDAGQTTLTCPKPLAEIYDSDGVFYVGSRS